MLCSLLGLGNAFNVCFERRKDEIIILHFSDSILRMLSKIVSLFPALFRLLEESYVSNADRYSFLHIEAVAQHDFMRPVAVIS